MEHIRDVIAEVLPGITPLCFTVPGEPVSKERPRTVRTRSGKRRTYTPRKTLDAELDIAFCCLEAYPQLAVDATSEFVLTVQFYLGTRRRKDGDNLLKTVKDALNGVVWEDDAQVTEFHGYLTRGVSEPRLVVQIHPRER